MSVNITLISVTCLYIYNISYGIFSSFLRHQYQSQLKQKTKQIQEELNEDKRLIEEILRCLEQEEKKTSRVKEETRQEIDRANAMLAEYTKLEKQREREMEFIFL